MLERQEIDALLISALYGELTPTEESRLTAHFATHPADKTALAALTSTREAVRESRILQVQLDPPQSVSALLLQEAARRAPKPAQQEGWFARLSRSFMAHPAMAAAAMLVVVVGVATLVNNRKGDQFVESSAPAVSNSAGSSTAADQTVLAPSVAATQAERKSDNGVLAGSGSDAYRVDLADGEAPKGTFGGKTETASPDPKAGNEADDRGNSDVAADRDGKVSRELDKVEVAKNKQKIAGEEATARTKDAKKAAPAQKPVAANGPYLELRSNDPAPKELEGVKSGRAYNYEDDLAKEQVNTITPGPRAGGSPGAGAGSAAATTPTTGTSNATPVAKTPARVEPKPDTKTPESQVAQQAPKQAPRPITAPAGTAAPRTPAPPRNDPAPPPPAKVAGNVRDERNASPPADKADKAEKPADRANDPQLAWAREQHTAILARVRSGDCKGAANLAVGLANRDLGYYQSNVATDRSVKECLAYIDNAREKDAEQRAERSRASQKRANEPSKRAADQPSKPATNPKATSTDSTK